MTTWKRALHAAIQAEQSQQSRSWKWVQLATCHSLAATASASRESQAMMIPSVRTVVFRGFLQMGQEEDGPELRCSADWEWDHVLFCTDVRSAKVRDSQDDDTTVREQQPAELCWMFPRSWQQFRIRGTLLCVGPSHSADAWQKARRDVWQQLSPASRDAFSQVGVPGAPLTEDAPPTGSDGYAHFALLALRPDAVDHLELAHGQQTTRTVYSTIGVEDGDAVSMRWTEGTRVYP